MNKKLCTKCKQLLSLANFANSNKVKSGKHAQCRECVRLYRVEYRATNKLAINQRKRNYRATNKDAINSARKAKSNTFVTTVSELLTGAKQRAKTKKLEFNLDKNWILEHLTNLTCEATGIPLLLKIDKRYSQSPFRPSIDKIDSTKGYTKDNSQIVSVLYNRTKSDYTHEDVLLMCKYLMNKNTT